MATVFVLYEGVQEGYENPAAAFPTEESARAAYEAQIEEGLADLNVGLYLGRLDNVSDEDFERVYDETPALADTEFEGFDLTVLESFASSIDDWDDDALTVVDEEFDASEDDYKIS